MSSSLLRRGLVALALGGLAIGGTTVIAPSANAGATGTYIGGSGGAYDSSTPGCTRSGDAGTAPLVPWSDNGGTVSASGSRSASYSDGTSITDFYAAGSGSVTATPIVGGPATVTISGAATATVRPRTATGGACRVSATGSLDIGATLSLPAPTWITITATGRGPSTTNVSGTLDFGAEVATGGTGTGSVRRLVPAGNVRLFATIAASATTPANATQAVQAAASGTVVFDLQPVGAASAPVGKASGLVPLGLRDCAANVVPAVVTTKTAKRAKRVEIRVNGARVVALKGKKLRKRTFALPVAAAAPATVTTTVVLKKGGRKVTGSRSYLACTD